MKLPGRTLIPCRIQIAPMNTHGPLKSVARYLRMIIVTSSTNRSVTVPRRSAPPSTGFILLAYGASQALGSSLTSPPAFG